MGSNRPIFIIGHPRSGTTLLRDLLRSHPNITFPDESHFIPTYYRAYGDPTSERAARRLGAKLLTLIWVRRWELTIDPGYFADCRTFRNVVLRLYEAWTNQEGKPRWGDKTPQYVSEIPTLRKIFPEAKFIHVIRDGRDVALSWVKYPHAEYNVFSVAENWKRLVTKGRSAGAKLSDDEYLELHYERLISQTEEIMRRVCDFLNESYTSAVLLPHRLPARLLPNVFGQRSTPDVSRAEIVSANSQKWKSKMSRNQCILFESIAGDVLADLGYETAGVTRIPSLAERVWWRCHSRAIAATRRLNLGSKPLWVPSHLKMKWARWRSRLRSVPGDKAEMASRISATDR